MTAARPPPGRTGFLIELRESIEYLINGDQFIADRVAEFGPVFSTTLFFRPTVVVGGQRNVAEFLNVDADVAESSLPAPLLLRGRPLTAARPSARPRRRRPAPALAPVPASVRPPAPPPARALPPLW